MSWDTWKAQALRTLHQAAQDADRQVQRLRLQREIDRLTGEQDRLVAALGRAVYQARADLAEALRPWDDLVGQIAASDDHLAQLRQQLETLATAPPAPPDASPACPACHQSVPPQSRFCPHCGAALPTA